MAAAEGDLPVVRVGDVLAGKYRVDRILGEGGMGVVVAATHLQIDEPVAIKLLHPDVVKDGALVARFQAEAKAARKIRSEHVVRILDVGELESGAPFIVMEYLAGMDLDTLVRSQGVRSIVEAVDFLLQACEALAEAHVQGMVHRDLKPANLFVTKRADETPLVKVLDFGISKVTGKDGADLGVTKTSSGLLGTPLYMAPEQMRSLREVDARTDVWALGIILHELLAGVPPFSGTTLPELCATILQEPPVPVRTLRPEVPPGLEAAILRCLVKEPAGRYPDVAALAMDIYPFASLAGRASAERIFGVYRVAGIPRASKPPTKEESARTVAMGADPTGPSLPLPPITPRPMTSRLGVATTGAVVWASGDSMPAPILSHPPPKPTNNVLVLVLVAMVAVLGTLLVVFVAVPRARPAPVVAAPAVAPVAVPDSAPVAAPAPPAPPPTATPEPVVSASASAVRRGRAPGKATRPDCTVPYTFDAKGEKHWKQECL